MTTGIYERNLGEFNCRICGLKTNKLGPAQIYCKVCGEKKNKEYEKKYRVKLKEYRRKNRLCLSCGKNLETKYRNCENCRNLNKIYQARIPKSKKKENDKKWTHSSKGREYAREIQKQKRKKPEEHFKMKSRYLSNKYIIIPKDKMCEICNKSPALERHHPDYSKPLEVNLLCNQCHVNLHRRIITYG